jgi:excisionase family DNA binding protein
MRSRGYLQVKEAAALLQVSPNTIRAWGETGKIPEYRHPLNGYRLYLKTDLEQVVQKLEEMTPRPVKKRRPRPR